MPQKKRTGSRAAIAKRDRIGLAVKSPFDSSPSIAFKALGERTVVAFLRQLSEQLSLAKTLDPTVVDTVSMLVFRSESLGNRSRVSPDCDVDFPRTIRLRLLHGMIN